MDLFGIFDKDIHIESLVDFFIEKSFPVWLSTYQQHPEKQFFPQNKN